MWDTPKHVEKIMEKCREVASRYNRSNMSSWEMMNDMLALCDEAEKQKVTLTWQAGLEKLAYSVRYEIA